MSGDLEMNIRSILKSTTDLEEVGVSNLPNQSLGFPKLFRIKMMHPSKKCLLGRR